MLDRSNPGHVRLFIRLFTRLPFLISCLLLAGGCITSFWSEMYTWHGQGKALGASEDDALYVWPGFRSNVTIPRCRTVILDVDIDVQLYSLVVWGTLVVQNRPDAKVSLRAMCISVRCVNIGYCGQVIAGMADSPFQGALEILLSGDEFSESHQCGGLKGKYLDVQAGAELLLYGQRPQRRWARLRETAEAGSYFLKLRGVVDWASGDELLIAGTGTSSGETERRIVDATQPVPAPGGGWDTSVALTQALRHSHIGVREVYNGHELEMRSEVAVLNRPLPEGSAARDAVANRAEPYTTSIRIAGVDSNLANWRFYSMAVSKHGVMINVKDGQRPARAVFSGVVIEDGGCHFPSIVCMRGYGFVGPALTCDGECTVVGSAVIPRLGHGIRAKSGSTIEGNVIYKPASGVLLHGTARVVGECLLPSNVEMHSS